MSEGARERDAPALGTESLTHLATFDRTVRTVKLGIGFLCDEVGGGGGVSERASEIEDEIEGSRDREESEMLQQLQTR